MTIEVILEIQQTYKKITKKSTKKDLCELMIPLRDKYHLTDKQVLSIARNELTLLEMSKIPVEE